jgi:CheY-like chemotaxis protein
VTRCVLVVDDEPDIRAVARLSLERVGGLRVIEASSGMEALEMAAASQPDAVLLDVMMPLVDGPTTYALLQADPRTRAIPVLLLTARADATERERWLAAGVRGVLAKPFDPMELPRLVSESLGWGP